MNDAGKATIRCHVDCLSARAENRDFLQALVAAGDNGSPLPERFQQEARDRGLDTPEAQREVRILINCEGKPRSFAA